MKYTTFLVCFLLLSGVALSGCASYSDSGIPNSTDTVVRVVDGDTLVLTSGEKVRLIGINTPEVGELYYDEATAFLSELVLGKEVLLEGDTSNRDKYGRLLRYVRVNGIFVNEQLVREGFAEEKAYEPDTRYQPLFEEAEGYAQAHDLGIWGIELEASGEVINYLDAGRYIGEVKTVEGIVVTTSKREDKGIIFLNFHDPYEGYLSVLIWSDDWDNFEESPEVYYEGRKVRVSGLIQEYSGNPEIIVRDPSQIEIVD
ncbi:micrococcal nuclease [Methanohalophilus levihalophilus]|uniref:thermonuclease family protein n=1 Tax=Methanohalophilus levihalophilus TaxID=1431282 RepID=UPI001AE1FA91|nr:thermonuclease family protein [Methanohalophilus levihalophilus]MBP2030637.1 micrococcal nuclease [Methanohalophilus levihalophilus]